MDIEVVPLSDALGAEITGVDLAREISVDQFNKIRRAWLDYKVIVFRGQALSPEVKKPLTAGLSTVALRRWHSL